MRKSLYQNQKIMNKILTFLFLFLISISIHSQNFKEEFGNDVCKCLTEKGEMELNTLLDCFTKNIANYQSELDRLIDKESNISEYDQGVALGRNLFFNMQQNLIQNCDIYFNFFDNLRNLSIVEMKKNYSQQTLDSISTQILKNKTTDLLWERGNLYFANDDLKNAEIDYLECLEINPNHIQSTLFLGWLNERKQNYPKAIELYQSVLDATRKKEIILFIELAKRKLKK